MDIPIVYVHFNIPEKSYDKGGSPISQVYLITGHFSVAPLLIFLRTLVLSGIQLGKCLLFALSAKPTRAVWVSSRESLFPTYSKVVVSTADLQRSVTICYQAKVRRIPQVCGRKMRQVIEAGKPQGGLGRQASCPDS